MKHLASTFFTRYAPILGVGLVTALLVPVSLFAQSPATVNLNSAGNFALLAGSTITNTGATTVTGDVGLSPGSAIDGFPPGIIIGTKHIDTTAARAKVDLLAAYNDAAGRTLNVITVSGNLGGQTLPPGLYKSQTSLAVSSGDLTLDGGGDANAVWIFQMGSSLTTTSGMHVVLAGKAQAKNIFWQVSTSATLGTTSIFYGNILALQSITLQTGATLNGRALARNGAVACDGNIVTPDTGSAAKSPMFSTASRNVTVGTTPVDTVLWKLVYIKNTGTDTLKFTLMTSTNSAFSSHLSSNVVAPGDSIIDSIKYLPTAAGADSAKLIYVSNSATTSPDTISAKGTGTAATVKTATFFTPARSVNAGTTHVDSATWTMTTIYNSGTDTLRLTSVTSTNAVFTSHLSAQFIAPGSSIIDTIKFVPTSEGATSGFLIFAGNQTSSPDTISVRGRGIVTGAAKSAILTVNSNYVYCGTTMVGTPTWTLISLMNSGDTTLTITSSTSTNTEFESHLTGTLIGPGQTVVDSIRFLPTASNGASGQLVFVSNAVTSPDTINVTGVGTPSTGVSDGAMPELSVLGQLFPNPLSDATQLTMQLTAGERVLHVGMYDMIGRQLQDWTSRINAGGTLSLHLGVFPGGQYLIQMHTTVRTQILPVLIVK